MKATIIILLTVILSLISCKDDNPTDKKEFQIINANITSNSFFPLAVGNEWVYDYIIIDTNLQHIKITGKIVLKDQEYFVCTSTLFNKDKTIDYENTFYVRTNDGMKFYEFKDSSESLILDFSDNITDSIYKLNYKTIDIPYLDLPFGRFNNCKRIETTIAFASEGISSTYASGIGLIRSAWFKGRLELIKARINNKDY